MDWIDCKDCCYWVGSCISCPKYKEKKNGLGAIPCAYFGFEKDKNPEGVV